MVSVKNNLKKLLKIIDITLAGPGITLRVADLILVNEEGKITEQENHFDASLLRG